MENYKPYYYYDNNEYTGFSLEIARIIANNLNYELEFYQVPFARAIVELENGNADMIANFFITPNRKNIVSFTTESHISESLHFFVKKGTIIPYYGHPSDLKNYKICIVKGYSSGPYIDTHLEEFSLESTSGETSQIKMITNERIPVAIGTKQVILTHAKKMGLSNEIKFLEPAISTDFVYMGFSKANPNAKKLALEFSEAIKELKKTTKYKELLKKYGFI